MWDFSWLERRWPGAGYEDWGVALDGLAERGYGIVRIDAYPHLASAAPEAWHTLRPCWSTECWGSPKNVRVRLWPELGQFVAACRERGIRVALSTWWREDERRLAWQITSPRAMAESWAAALRLLDRDGLLDAVIFTDLSNEWPTAVWTPFFKNPVPGRENAWRDPAAMAWMGSAIASLRAEFPAMAFTFSTCTAAADWQLGPVPGIDLGEVHWWMIGEDLDFYRRIGYEFQTWDEVGYERLAERAEPLYRSDESHWKARTAGGIDLLAAGSVASGLPLVTTEGWATVVWKDGPGLDWGWVKELNAFAVERVVEHGRWLGVCTSNFCGPQFAGMWSDVEWHRRLTARIGSGPLRGEFWRCPAGASESI